MIDINKLIERKEPKIAFQNEKMIVYCCDFCNTPIFCEKNNITGGMLELPYTLIGKKGINVVLHNKCLNRFIKEYERRKNGKEKS